MTEEIQIAVVNDPTVVAIPQPQIEVLTERIVVPIVIESPQVEVVVLGDEVHIVDEVRETTVVTVGEKGPKGDPGQLGAGTNTGDFIRFNQLSGEWEMASEPIALKGFVLTPAVASLIDAEGAVYYSSVDKAVKVCTEI